MTKSITFETISFDDALDKTLGAAASPIVDTVGIHDALNRILAKEIVSDIHMPPFNKSAMDGYACRRQDLKKPLLIVDEIPAGQTPKQPVGENECAKIMTGAPVPSGADCVIMVEMTELSADGKVLFTGTNTNDNICAKSEDITDGDVVLAAGVLITPAHIAVLATVGVTTVPVYRAPRISVVATGSELVEPSNVPHGAQIRNSNSYQLCAQIKQMGLDATYLGIAEDTPQSTTEMIEKARKNSDIIILSGGVSMGDYDYVPGVLQGVGFKFCYQSVAMQPGRPTVFGCDDRGTCCFGLPGNPVSTYVVFEILLKPFLYKWMGYKYQPRIVQAELLQSYHRKKARRQITVPVRFATPSQVELLEYHGSAHINALCLADGFVTIPAGETHIAKGSNVHVRCI